MNDRRADDTAAASAACLYNVLPQIMAEEPSEAFRRLHAHLKTCIRAYCDGQGGWYERPALEPSNN